MKKRYAYFDGDKVGNAMKHLLRHGRNREATHLSEKIKIAIFQIAQHVREVSSGQVIIAGGDDILLSFDPERYGVDSLKKLADLFRSLTGLTMSYGVGDTVDQALANLSITKNPITSSSLGNNHSTGTRGETLDTHLWIFATSDIPDPYINVLAHCKTYYGISKATLVGIVKDRGKNESVRDYLLSLKSHINEQTAHLSNGKYLWFNRREEKWDTKPVNLEVAAQRRYAGLQSIDIDVRTIEYDSLELAISACIDSAPDKTHIFDVTTVLKSQLVDVFLILCVLKRGRATTSD